MSQQQQRILEKEVCKNKLANFSQFLPRKDSFLGKVPNLTMHRATDQETCDRKARLRIKDKLFSSLRLSTFYTNSILVQYLLANHLLKSKSNLWIFSASTKNLPLHYEPVPLQNKSIFPKPCMSAGRLINIQLNVGLLCGKVVIEYYKSAQRVNEKTRFRCTDRINKPQ